MRLKNKKTGEIREIKEILIDNMWVVDSLIKFNDNWEECEESKTFWFIGEDGCPHEGDETVPLNVIDRFKSIGNYFETREEADKAVEKLKAWKRLKDKGLRFIDWDPYIINNPNRKDDGEYIYKAMFDVEKEKYGYDCDKDLDLLFGGEE